MKTDPLGLLVFVGDGRWDAAEFSVLEPVGVAFESDDVGVVDEAVDDRGSDDFVPFVVGGGADYLLENQNAIVPTSSMTRTG